MKRTSEGRKTIAGISKDLIVKLVLEELELADELLEKYFANPPQPIVNDDPLGFGADIMVAPSMETSQAVRTSNLHMWQKYYDIDEG